MSYCYSGLGPITLYDSCSLTAWLLFPPLRQRTSHRRDAPWPSHPCPLQPRYTKHILNDFMTPAKLRRNLSEQNQSGTYGKHKKTSSNSFHIKSRFFSICKVQHLCHYAPHFHRKKTAGGSIEPVGRSIEAGAIEPYIPHCSKLIVGIKVEQLIIPLKLMLMRGSDVKTEIYDASEAHVILDEASVESWSGD